MRLVTDSSSFPLFIIVGPTGIGKTAVSLALCERFGGEIISADSMQIYRGCDIATAKPTNGEQARAHHHLIDICDPRDSYSAAQWAYDARQVLADIGARGKVPLVVGGTGFYLKALLKPDLTAPAPPNPSLRYELARVIEKHGSLVLHQRLQTLDPAAAARLHVNDTFRVTRAIEVALWQREQPPQPETERSPLATPTFRAFRLHLERETLNQRLNARVDAMLQAGVMNELRALLESGVPRDAPALRGVGYKEMLPALDDPAQLDACLEAWKRETRRYAKRQETWFRHQIAAEPVSMDEYTPASAAQWIAERIAAD